MKYLYQFLVILGFSFAGEMIHAVVPLPVPASVYGLVLLFVCLMLEVVKLNQIEEAADFFLANYACAIYRCFCQPDEYYPGYFRKFNCNHNNYCDKYICGYGSNGKNCPVHY